MRAFASKGPARLLGREDVREASVLVGSYVALDVPFRASRWPDGR